MLYMNTGSSDFVYAFDMSTYPHVKMPFLFHYTHTAKFLLLCGLHSGVLNSTVHYSYLLVTILMVHAPSTRL